MEESEKIEEYTPEQVKTYTPENPEPAMQEPKETESKTSKENHHNTQVYNIVTGKDPSWQTIIYDLISTEQLDPWNIDLGQLCSAYFEKIKELEESNFFVSSKILLAASLLLRIKSEILLNKHIKEIDEVLFGKKQEIDKVFERIELDENELPLLIPKSPMPRLKKVTLDELMSALDTAIKTESRRVHKELEKKQTERLAYIDIPKHRRVNIKDRIRQFYATVLSNFKHPTHKDKLKLPFSHFTKDNKEEKIAFFAPMLHLSNAKKLWLEQDGHFEEIYMYLYKIFKENFPDHDSEMKELEQELEEELKKDIKEIKQDLDNEQLRRVEKLNKDFENPIGNLLSE